MQNLSGRIKHKKKTEHSKTQCIDFSIHNKRRQNDRGAKEGEISTMLPHSEPGETNV